MDLRLAGFEHRQIAKKLGVALSTAHSDVDLMLSELADSHSKEAAHLRALQTQRYEKLLSKVWPNAQSGDLPSLDRCVSLLGRIDKINGLDDGRSLAVWIQSQTEVRIGTGEGVPAETLKEYADVIRGLVALGEDDTVAAEPQPANGHRECFSV